MYIAFMATYRAQGQGEQGEAQPKEDRSHQAEASGLFISEDKSVVSKSPGDTWDIYHKPKSLDV